LDGHGGISSEFEDIAICDRAGCNWLELQEMPERVVENYKLLIRAEIMKAKQDKR